MFYKMQSKCFQLEKVIDFCFIDLVKIKINDDLQYHVFLMKNNLVLKWISKFLNSFEIKFKKFKFINLPCLIKNFT